MHDKTALRMLQDLAQEGVVEVRDKTFLIDKFPELYHHNDTADAFRAVADKLNFKANTHYRLAQNWGVEFACVSESLFEKLFKLMFLAEGLWPAVRSETVDAPAPLPTLFIGSEKTQVRQIPLTRERPWPFNFLLELGGMIVVVPESREQFVAELRQFVNNHPQFHIGVYSKDRPDGTIAVSTYWFADVPKNKRRNNVNAPE